MSIGPAVKRINLIRSPTDRISKTHVNYIHASFLSVSLIADFFNTGRLEHRKSYLHCDVSINTEHPRLQKIHLLTCQLQGRPQD